MAWPKHVVSTKSQKDDDNAHFVLEAAGAAGTYAVRTQSGRYWAVTGAEGLVYAEPAKPGGAQAQAQFEIKPTGQDTAGQCFSVTSPGFNPSWDPTATSGVVQWPCRSDDDCSLNGKCGSGGVCNCRPAWKGARLAPPPQHTVARRHPLRRAPAGRGAARRGPAPWCWLQVAWASRAQPFIRTAF